MYVWLYKGRSRYILCSYCVNTVSKRSENTIIIYSWVPLIFRILSLAHQVTNPIHSLYCNIIDSWAESARAHRYITNHKICCLFICLLTYFTAVTPNTSSRKLTTVSLIATYYGVNIIYVCIVASTSKQVWRRQDWIIIYMPDGL